MDPSAGTTLLEELAVTTHGALVAGHAISAVYNVRRARRIDGWVLFHAAAALVSAWAVHTHYRRLTAPESQRKEGR